METRETKPNNTVVCRKDHGSITKDTEYRIVPNNIYKNDNEKFYAIYDRILPVNDTAVINTAYTGSSNELQIKFFSKIHFYTKQELRIIKLNKLIEL